MSFADCRQNSAQEQRRRQHAATSKQAKPLQTFIQAGRAATNGNRNVGTHVEMTATALTATCLPPLDVAGVCVSLQPTSSPFVCFLCRFLQCARAVNKKKQQQLPVWLLFTCENFYISSRYETVTNTDAPILLHRHLRPSQFGTVAPIQTALLNAPTSPNSPQSGLLDCLDGMDSCYRDCNWCGYFD